MRQGAAVQALVFASVEQHVAQGIVDGTRSAQRARVVALCKDAALASELVVNGARDADAEALQPASERTSIFRLGDQVEVVALDGVVNEAKAEALSARGEGLLHSGEQRGAAK